MIDNNSNIDIIAERGMMFTNYFETMRDITKEDFDYMMTLNVVPDITFLLYVSVDT